LISPTESTVRKGEGNHLKHKAQFIISRAEGSQVRGKNKRIKMCGDPVFRGEMKGEKGKKGDTKSIRCIVHEGDSSNERGREKVQR